MKSKITLKISIVVLSVFALYLIPFKAHSQLVIADGGELVIGSGSYVVAGKGVKNTNTANDAIKLSGILRIVSGDFTNNAASGSLLIGSTGTVEFTGSAAQAINGSRATYFNNLLINNTSAAGITHTSVQSFVGGTLTLTDGVINTNAGHELVMQAGSSYTGGSDASHIDGPMSKVGSTDFRFPVGDAGFIEQIEIQDLPGSNTFTAEYFRTTPSDYTNYTGPNIHDVSSVEYWDIHPASGTPQINLSLNWNSGTFSGIVHPDSLVGAHYTGSGWEEIPYISSTGNATNGSIKFGPVTTYSNFTFGSVNNVSDPLPVALLSFDISPLRNSIDLIWVTASELNNDVFEIQRSENAVDFETIGMVKGAGNSNTLLTYRFNDKDVDYATTYYYRLKQVDFDGKYEYSDVRIGRLKKDYNIKVQLSPNPCTNFVHIHTNIEEPYQLAILDMRGKIVLQRKVLDSTTDINISSLAQGVYLVRIFSANKIYKTQRISKI